MEDQDVMISVRVNLHRNGTMTLSNYKHSDIDDRLNSTLILGLLHRVITVVQGEIRREPPK